MVFANKQGKKLISEVNLFDVFQDESKLGKGKKSYAVSFIFEDKEKGLKGKAVDKTMSQITRQCEEQLGAEIRK